MPLFLSFPSFRPSFPASAFSFGPESGNEGKGSGTEWHSWTLLMACQKIFRFHLKIVKHTSQSCTSPSFLPFLSLSMPTRAGTVLQFQPTKRESLIRLQPGINGCSQRSASLNLESISTDWSIDHQPPRTASLTSQQGPAIGPFFANSARFRNCS